MRRQLWAAGALSLIGFVLVPSGLMATSVSITASRDTTIYSDRAGNSNGAGLDMSVGFAGGGVQGGSGARRGLVYFDIFANVPAGATINSASLALTYNGGASAGPTHVSVALQRLLADWGEGTSNTAAGIGTTATQNDATWTARLFDASNPINWSTPGADFVASSASQTIDRTSSVGTVYTWQSAGLTADVQQWLNNPATTFGWVLIGNESTTNTTRRFNSHEAAAGLRPVLSIDFTPVPEPKAAALLLFGFIGAAIIVRR